MCRLAAHLLLCCIVLWRGSTCDLCWYGAAAALRVGRPTAVWGVFIRRRPPLSRCRLPTSIGAGAVSSPPCAALLLRAQLTGYSIPRSTLTLLTYHFNRAVMAGVAGCWPNMVLVPFME